MAATAWLRGDRDAGRAKTANCRDQTWIVQAPDAAVAASLGGRKLPIGARSTRLDDQDRALWLWMMGYFVLVVGIILLIRNTVYSS